MSTTSRAPFEMLNTHLPLPAVAASNPFAPVDPTDVPANAPEGSYTYALVQSAPAVPAEECEVSAAAAEIVLRWGATTLHVAHLAPPRPFVVGEASDRGAVDFELPADRIGVARLPVVRVAADGSARVVIPAGAKGTATIAGQIVKIADLATGNHGEASAEIPGAVELPLRAGTRVRFESGGIEIDVASVNAGRKVSGRFSFDRRGLPFQAMSTALHLGLLGAAAVFMPPMALASEDTLSHDQIDSLKMILSTTAEREPDAAKDPAGDSAPGARESHSGHAAPGEPGKAGSTQSRNKNGRAGVAGPSDNTHVSLSRAETLAMARDFGMVGLLRATSGDSRAPSSPWGDVALGRDPASANGNLYGTDIAEAAGGGGMTLTGVGDGGGGDGTGIGVDKNGMFGPDTGFDRFGPRRPLGPGRHRPKDLSMRQEDPKVSSRIPQELIQRVVRQSFGRFRLCYEKGLRGNPNLGGRVSVRFVIGRDGGVMSASDGGSSLPDASVVSCVVSSFRGLQFPQGEEASVATVVYPIVFSPAK